MDYFQQLLNLYERFKELSVVAWISALLVGFATSYGSLIGYNNGNNDAINFIAFLVICDFITRFIAQLVIANETFPKKENGFILFDYVRLFIFAHKIKAISSHAFMRGFFIKAVSYTILLGVAQFASNTTSIPFIGSFAVIIYGGLIVYDLISVLENLSEMGFSQASGLLTIFKRKAKQFEEESK